MKRRYYFPTGWKTHFDMTSDLFKKSAGIEMYLFDNSQVEDWINNF